MGKIKDLKEDVQDAKKLSLLNAAETSVNSKVGKHLKNFIYIASLTGMGFFINSCVAGYVGSEPAYVEYSRPARPSNLYVWIDGDWGWNNQTHVYVQKAGYWDRPRQGQTYVSGRWQTTQKGKSWSKGHWQRQERHENYRKR